MKNQKTFLNVLLAFGMLATVSMGVVGCGDDDDDAPAEVSLTALTAGSIDLNGATSPMNIPANAAITATFNTDVDATSATAANVTLTRDYDDAAIPVTVAASGKTITVTPNDDLGSGTLYILKLSGIKSTGGKTLSSAVERNFTTAGTFSPDGVIAHWTFEDNANDVVGSYDPSTNQIVDITYTAGRNANAGKAATFNGLTSIIEVSNGDELMDTESFTLSFWVKANHPTPEDTRGHFVLGLGAFNGFQMEIPGDYSAIQFPASFEYGDGTTGTGGNLSFDGKGILVDTWQGVEVRKDLTASGGVAALVKDKWAHMVYSYNQATMKRQLYINGVLMESENFNLWPEDTKERTIVGLKYAGVEPDVVNELAFGFIQSRAGTLWDEEPWGGYDKATANHFEGQLDDIRIFHKALTDQEISLMYNSEKP